MNKLAFIFVFFLGSTIGAQPPDPTRQERQPLTRVEPERAAKAQELLAQARAALSQRARLDDIKTLSVNGKLRRAAMAAARSSGGNASATMIGGDIDPSIFGAENVKEYFADGKVEYDIARPDKLRWEENVEHFQRLYFFDGEQFGLKNNNRTMVTQIPRFTEALRQQLLAGQVHITLGLLLTPPPTFPLEFSAVGEKPFRHTVAEVIAITGPGAFKAELYLDQKSYLPLLLRFVIGGISRPAMVFTPAGTPRSEGMRQLEIAKQQAAARPPGQQEREKLILFEDYRAVDGVLFPHKISTQINGKLIEELSFTKFKLNQPIKPEKFTERQ